MDSLEKLQAMDDKVDCIIIDVIDTNHLILQLAFNEALKKAKFVWVIVTPNTFEFFKFLHHMQLTWTKRLFIWEHPHKKLIKDCPNAFKLVFMFHRINEKTNPVACLETNTLSSDIWKLPDKENLMNRIKNYSNSYSDIIVTL